MSDAHISVHAWYGCEGLSVYLMMAGPEVFPGVGGLVQRKKRKTFQFETEC